MYEQPMTTLSSNTPPISFGEEDAEECMLPMSFAVDTDSDNEVIDENDDKFEYLDEAWKRTFDYRPEYFTAKLERALVPYRANLSLHGWRLDAPPIDVRSLETHRQVAIALHFLRTNTRATKAINLDPTESSGGLRVAARAWWQTYYHCDGYVANGSMIVALILANYMNITLACAQQGPTLQSHAYCTYAKLPHNIVQSVYSL